MTYELSSVRRVRIGRELLEYTHDSLREMSSEDDGESMALWAGRFESAEHFTVDAVKIPEQVSVHTRDGLAVLVEGDALHELNVWLFRNELRLLAQIHTHPGSAYHSETDDTIPIVAVRGGLSLVVPDFARGPADLETYAGYRLGASDTWNPLSPAELRELVHVFPRSSQR